MTTSRERIERVLVTGGSGFIGSHVVERLVGEGRKVALLLRRDGSRRRIESVLHQCSVVEGDLTQLGACSARVLAFRPQCVLHLGWTGVQGALRDDAVQLQNVAASLALYRLAQEAGCESFVGLGSQAEYGPCTGRVREDTPAKPTTVYGAAKLAVATVLERYAAHGGPAFVWLRLFSCYGPGEDPAWLIAYLTRTLLAGDRPSLTQCEQVWDYLHVEDAVDAIVRAMDSRARGLFNLGSGQPRALRDVVLLVRDAINPALPLGFGEVPYRADQVMHLEADIGALIAATGWRPRIALEQGIEATVASYRAGAGHA